jgi:hypothetical protein
MARAGRFLRPVLLLVATLAAAPAARSEGPAGAWWGTIQGPGGRLDVHVHLALDAAGWTGTIDIPAQGAFGLALGDIEADRSRVRFAIVGVPGDPSFDGELAGDEIAGTFTQRGQRLPFALQRAAGEPRGRPQDPPAAAPYRSEEVRFTSDGVELAATLTLPPGPGVFPAVVLLSGSGAQNRDGELMGHRPFLVLADHLTRRGVAVLRADDRGVGGSEGSLAEATSSDLAGDALAAVRYLRSRPEVAWRRIGLLGHSEGGLVAPLAASRSSDVRFLVLLAAPGVPGRELLPVQTRRIALATGVPQSTVERQVALLEEGLALLTSGVGDAAARRGLLDVARRQLELAGGRPGDAVTDASIAQEVDLMLTPWFRFFLSHDPREALRRVEVPVLAIQGGLDLQVDAEQNLPQVRAALAEGGNRDVTIQRLPGLNHLLQTAGSGAPSEYFQIDETLAPQVLDLVSRWIVERFGAAAGA